MPTKQEWKEFEKVSTSYEWCYETIDENGDIVELDHADKLQDFQDNRKTNTLCLIRDTGSNAEGLQDRMWAYVKDGKMPECFSDELGHEMPAMKVPQRFHQEFAKHYTA